MSCRRARRQLLWLVRFGELDQESAPHLEHLAGCRACRDEVGLDRALVRELRTALAARVEDVAPSPAAWDGVLARMRQPEPRRAGLRALVTRFAGALRAGTAMAGAGLALVLALNLEVVPVLPLAAPTETPTQEAAIRPEWAGDIPPFVVVAPPAAPITTDESAVTSTDGVTVRPMAQAEQLPLDRNAAAEIGQTEAQPGPEERSNIEPGWPVLSVRLVPSDAARIAAAGEPAGSEPAAELTPAPDPSVPGPS